LAFGIFFGPMLCQTKCYDATFVFFSTPRFIKHKAVIQPWHFPLPQAIFQLWRFPLPSTLSSPKPLFNLDISPRPKPLTYSTLAFAESN
jgi:hypothetical protein